MENNEKEIDLINTVDNDIVGSTAYSSKWILETLNSLSEIEKEDCSKEMENNLCILWDMTAEKDVVDFLMENNFLFLFDFVLQTSNSPRLKEIIVGILGNICTQPEIFTSLSNEPNFIPKILDLMFNEDSKVLIQVLRILDVAVWDVETNSSSKWTKNLEDCKFLGSILVFILNSSLDEELLQSTLNSIHSLISNDRLRSKFIQKLTNCEINAISALIESYKILFSDSDSKDPTQWIEILSKFLYNQLPGLINDCHVEVVNILTKLLKEKEDNVDFLDENSASCIYECVQIVYWMQKRSYEVESGTVCSIVKITNALKEALISNPDDEVGKELLDYLERYWTKIANETEISKKIKQSWPESVQDYLKSLSLNE